VVECQRSCLGLEGPKRGEVFLAKSVCKVNLGYYYDLFICLNELEQRSLGRLCLSQAILAKTSPSRASIKHTGQDGKLLLTLLRG